MSQLAYLTRGNTSPQSKPRVYFCCHPDDQSAFLQPTAKELLAQADCSVWYNPEPSAPLSPEERKERESDLAQMQLFVLPVTARLLTSPSPALEWEFPLALKQHIPVLPILQEPGLEALFNKKCGDLQCLDPNQTDPTALPYEERLKKFLDSVLIGDELASQVRAAFDAYIFLSYRKKDRREAQSLMRLIHESAFCRDIAIWYDEFLTPGEDFNQAIAQALEKSNLFVLTVTPHLLEHPNYVMNEEFPAAKNSGKPILPVEMVHADRPALEAAYPGIPPCASGQDKPVLSEGLKAALRGLALRENDSDPRHNFFIGLAYLTGIDVEVNKERAVELIRGAGDAGLLEAMEKLVTMYHTGEGVNRDYRQAAQWQRRLADALRVQWEKAPTEDAFQALADALWDLGDQYTDLADLSASRRVWEEEFLPLTRQGEEQGISCARRYQACGYSSLGNLCRQQGNLTEARRWLKKSSKLRFDLSHDDNTIQIRRDTVESQLQLGLLCLEEENDMASVYFQMAVELARALVRDAGEVRDRRLLATACEWLGSEYRNSSDKKDLPKALKLLEEGQQLRRALNDEIGTIYTRQSLAASSMGLGDLLRKMGDLPGTRRCYEESLTLYRDLVDETGMLNVRRNLALCLCRMGTLCRLEGDLPGAHRCYEEGLALFRDLAEKTGTVDARRDLASGYNLLSALCRREDNLPAARRWLEESVKVRRAIVDETGLARARDALASDLCKLGCLPDGDAGHLYQAVELWDNLADGKSSTSSYSEKRYNAILALAEHKGELKAPANLEAAARRLFEESLAQAPALMSRAGKPQSWWHLMSGYLKMGLIGLKEGNDCRAGHWFKEGLRVARSAAEKSGAPEDRHALALFLCHLGILPCGNPTLLEEAAGTWARLAAECPQIPKYAEFRDLAAALLARRAGESEDSDDKRSGPVDPKAPEAT